MLKKKKKLIVGFSATDSRHVGKEAILFSQMQVTEYNSGLVPSEQMDAGLIDQQKKMQLLIERINPTIIYTTPAEAKRILDMQLENTYMNITDHNILRHLEQKNGSDKYILLVITTNDLLRGIDYRGSVGIDLILDKQFAGVREAQQALHRVGRNGDKCRRFKTNKNLVSAGMAV